MLSHGNVLSDFHGLVFSGVDFNKVSLESLFDTLFLRTTLTSSSPSSR